MKCPYCNGRSDRVVDSREGREGAVIRRRRECLECNRRFTSYETVEEIPFMVVKRDESPRALRPAEAARRAAPRLREAAGAVGALEDIVLEVEYRTREREEREIDSKEIGAIVMEKLRNLDQVAYVRFASVYRRFEDIDEFMTELKGLLGPREPGGRTG